MLKHLLYSKLQDFLRHLLIYIFYIRYIKKYVIILNDYLVNLKVTL